MFTKVTSWVTLGACLLAVAWSTWPRTVAQQQSTNAAFLQHESAWIDSVLKATDQDILLSQRLGILLDGDDSLADPASISQLILRYQPGSLWFQDMTHTQIARQLSILPQDGSIELMIGSLPSQSLYDSPSLLRGNALAGISTLSGLAGLSDAIGHSAKGLGISSIGIPALTAAFDPEQQELMQYPASDLIQQFSTQGLLPILTEADQWVDILLADSLERKKLLAPYSSWNRAPIAGWIVEEPTHGRLEVNLSDIVTILRQELGYQGMILAKMAEHPSPDAYQASARKMLLSGADIILVNSRQLELISSEQSDMARTGLLSYRKMTDEVEKVIQAKSWTQSSRPDSISPTADPVLNWELQAFLESQVSLIQENNGPIPVTNLMDRTVHVVEMGTSAPRFVSDLRKYFPVSVSKGFAADPWFALASIRLKKYDPLILVFREAFPKGLERKKLWQQVNTLTETTPVVVVNLGDAARMAELPASVTLIQGNDAGVIGQSVVAQMIAGGLPITGRFPLALSERLFVGAESFTQKTRLAYGPAESVGLDSRILARIDSIAWEGISELAMPGAQILVAKKGRVIYNQSHGYHTYLKRRGVYPTDLYDIASMTKIMGTTLAAMSMYDQGKLELNAPIRKYFRDPYIWQDSLAWTDTLYVGLDSSQVIISDSIQNDDTVLAIAEHSDTTFLPGDSILVIRHVSEGRIRRPSPVLEPTITDLMTHTSGLPAGINIREFYSGKTAWKRNKQYFSQRPDSLFTVPVARDLYLRTDMLDSIWATTLAMNRRDSAGYKYSDANMILVQRVIDSINRQSIDRYLDRTWYSPLGLQHTTFQAADAYKLDRLIPTEYDRRYRSQTLQGYVHDPTAALMGGVSGNAGLFSTAEDLAIIGQMWLQQGQYGGKQWLTPQTVELFTQRQAGHRGLGFDKPPYEGEYLIAPSASPNSFGHTGFTGTLIWMDPDEELMFIFLSNRVHPRANNWLLNQMKIRQRAHEVVYEAIRAAQPPLVAAGE